MGNQKKVRGIADTEFSIEFGDVNGKKLVEFPLKRKEKERKK